MSCKARKGNPLRPAVTLIEMLMAMTIIAVIFAAILPQFRNMQNSWESRQGNAEAIQNARVFIDHINRHIGKAAKVTGISDSNQTSGYIEFLDTDGNNWRYDVNSSGYIEYGLVGNLEELAGPVSQLQFTCYGMDDFNSPTTDVNSIRLVNVNAVFENSSANGQDKAFSADVFIRPNYIDPLPESVDRGPLAQFSNTLSTYPAMAQIDSTHYFLTWSGATNEALASVLTVDVNALTVTEGASYQYQSVFSTPAVWGVDSSHFLCAYNGPSNYGWARILAVNPTTWAVSGYTGLTFDPIESSEMALCQIDSTHYLCAYQGASYKGNAIVLTVNTSTWAVTKGTKFNYAATGKWPALCKIDATHYLCTYVGSSSTARAVVLEINTSKWTITAKTAFQFDTIGNWFSIAPIVNNRFLVAYEGENWDGYVTVLAVNTSTWAITKATPSIEYDAVRGKWCKLVQLTDDYRYLCAYSGTQGAEPPKDSYLAGKSIMFKVNTSDWSIDIGPEDCKFDRQHAEELAVWKIDDTHALVAYHDYDEVTGYNGGLRVLERNPYLWP